jgi:hypothetical protein
VNDAMEGKFKEKVVLYFVRRTEGNFGKQSMQAVSPGIEFEVSQILKTNFSVAVFSKFIITWRS